MMKTYCSCRKFLIGLGEICLILTSCVWGSASAQQQTPRSDTPNIVFILVDDLGWSDVGCYKSGKTELYNLSEDMGEAHDLSGEHPEVTRDLLNLLKTWQEHVDVQF